jgi:hypothetical protein
VERNQYPTLQAIGLGPQLAELERICAESAKGKHKGGGIFERGVCYHWDKAESHIKQAYLEHRDPESGAYHFIHAAARLLMAAACQDRFLTPVKDQWGDT